MSRRQITYAINRRTRDQIELTFYSVLATANGERSSLFLALPNTRGNERIQPEQIYPSSNPGRGFSSLSASDHSRRHKPSRSLRQLAIGLLYLNAYAGSLQTNARMETEMHGSGSVERLDFPDAARMLSMACTPLAAVLARCTRYHGVNVNITVFAVQQSSRNI